MPLPQAPSAPVPSNVTLSRLNLVERGNVDRLDVVLKARDQLLEHIDRDLVVLNDARDLELLDAKGDGLELGCIAAAKRESEPNGQR